MIDIEKMAEVVSITDFNNTHSIAYLNGFTDAYRRIIKDLKIIKKEKSND